MSDEQTSAPLGPAPSDAAPGGPAASDSAASGPSATEPAASAPAAFDPASLGPEDRKIVTLARSARARNGADEGAAVRDETGRTYVATTVALQSLRLTAVQTAVAMAVASGAKGLEAAAVVTRAERPADADLAAVRDLGGSGTPVLVAGYDGVVRAGVPAP